MAYSVMSGHILKQQIQHHQIDDTYCKSLFKKEHSSLKTQKLHIALFSIIPTKPHFDRLCPHMPHYHALLLKYGKWFTLASQLHKPRKSAAVSWHHFVWVTEKMSSLFEQSFAAGLSETKL